ncbi:MULTISPECIES: hypothetical protein [unclassified Luteococcus]|uniref:hypothetical protein n=1 Tax=unclassified Luteococcus TaxID=2639923 RepID=UPI00313C4C2A
MGHLIDFPGHLQEPLGIFRAVSSRDGVACERDGQVYVAMNMLGSSSGRAVAEVQFSDGVWILADPEHDLFPLDP